jgi:E3 ubiquitin-protein ligase MARCH6
MPKQLPFILFLRKFAKQLALGALFILRGAMVALIWLAFLPYVTVWTWRFYFIVGDNV